MSKEFKLRIVFSSILFILFSLLTFFRFNPFDAKLFDTFYHFQKNTKTPDEITLIFIDDETLSPEKLNTTFPFRRKLFSDALEILSKHSPKVIGMDFFFTEKGIYPEDDALLSKTIKESKTPIVLTSMLIPSQKPIFQAHYGFADSFDSSIRNFLPAFSLPGSPTEYMFPIKILQVLGYNISVDNQTMFFNNKTYPLDDLGHYPIHFFRKNYNNINFYNLLTNNFNPNLIKDKIIILAPSYWALNDFHKTPLTTTRLIGGEIHANIIEMLIKNDLIILTPFYINLIILLIFSLFFLFFPLKYIEYTLIIPIILPIISLFAFIIFKIHLPIAFPVIMSLILPISLIIKKVFELIKNLRFNQKVPSETLSEFVQSQYFCKKWNITDSKKNILSLLMFSKLTIPKISKKLFKSPDGTKKTIQNQIYPLFPLKSVSRNKRDELIKFVISEYQKYLEKKE